MSKLTAIALLTGAAVALAPSWSTSRAAGSNRAGTIAFIRMLDPRFYGGGAVRGAGRRQRSSPGDTAEHEGLVVCVVARRPADRLHRPAVLALAGAPGRDGTQVAPPGIAAAQPWSLLVAGRRAHRDRLAGSRREAPRRLRG